MKNAILLSLALVLAPLSYAAQINPASNFADLKLHSQVYVGTELRGNTLFNNGVQYDSESAWVFSLQKTCRTYGSTISGGSLVAVIKASSQSITLAGLDTWAEPVQTEIRCSKATLASFLYNTGLYIKFFTPGHFNLNAYAAQVRTEKAQYLDQQQQQEQRIQQLLAEQAAQEKEQQRLQQQKYAEQQALIAKDKKLRKCPYLKEKITEMDTLLVDIRWALDQFQKEKANLEVNKSNETFDKIMLMEQKYKELAAELSQEGLRIESVEFEQIERLPATLVESAK